MRVCDESESTRERLRESLRESLRCESTTSLRRAVRRARLCNCDATGAQLAKAIETFLPRNANHCAEHELTAMATKHVYLLVAALISQPICSSSSGWIERCRPLHTDKRPLPVVDASVRFPNGDLFVFSGDQVSRISSHDGQHGFRADRGWPKYVSDVWPSVEPGIDAAFALRNRVFLLKVTLQLTLCVSQSNP